MSRVSAGKLFPKDFLWGASVSAHQVEGGNRNQWSEWEDANALALSHQSEYKNTWLPNWEQIKKDALDPNNYISGRASNHYQLYEQDFDLLAKLNMNTFRFSIEWSRIQPYSDKDWDVHAIRYYREYITALKTRGIEPVVTLWHFTHPVWFEKRGGFAKYNNITYFVAFADRIMRELGQDIRFIITINEPDTFVYNGYRIASWPPQRQTFMLSLDVYRNLLIAHKQIYKKLQKHKRPYSISFAKTYAAAYAGDDRLISKLTAWFHRFLRDTAVLYQVKHCMDFVAVNYYFADRYIGFRLDQPNTHQSDIGWSMEPEKIADVLLWLHKKYKKPILITENGLADAEDKRRKWWLQLTFKSLINARQNGVKLIGYLHWSLIDNFEWALGKWPRFGLYAVDYKTMKRIPRKSALWLSGILTQLKR